MEEEFRLLEVVQAKDQIQPKAKQVSGLQENRIYFRGIILNKLDN